ncbi:MAG TPA: nuclear transport factor 2 family protein [Terriglobales bacterium]|nr:nuclear transport factor 2 family protein [Terriglobales bacterium]
MLRPKLYIVIGLLLPVVACTEGKPPQSQDWTHATGAEAHERLWWKAIQDRDFPEAERRLAPMYTLTVPSGILEREQAVHYFQSLNLTSIALGEIQVKPEGPDMVVSYVATLQTKSSPAPQRCYMTTVWQQVKRGWVAISHSEVPATAEVSR